MNEVVQIIGTVSRQNFDLWQQGKAVLEKGGLKTPDGKFIELIRPVIGDVRENSQKLDQLKNMVGSKSNILEALPAVNVALSLANIGISLWGFQKTFKMLDEISRKLKIIEERLIRIEAKLDDAYVLDYKDIIRSIEFYYNEVSNEHLSFENTYTDIQITIEHGIGKLEDLCKKLKKGEMDENQALLMIVYLVEALTHMIKQYSTCYYYTFNRFPVHLDNWLDIIEAASGNDMKQYIQMYLNINHPKMMPEDRASSCKLILESIHEAVKTIKNNRSLCKQLPKADYIRLPHILEENMKLPEKVSVNGENVCIQIA